MGDINNKLSVYGKALSDNRLSFKGILQGQMIKEIVLDDVCLQEGKHYFITGYGTKLIDGVLTMNLRELSQC